MKRVHVLLLLLSLLPLAAHAQAQTVWRCGPDGRTYSSTPCADGRAVTTTDARPPADVQAAQAAAAREARLAEQLRRERLQAEARTMGNGAGSLSAAQPAPVKPAGKAQAPSKKKTTTPKKLDQQQRHAAEAGTSPAIAPASPRKKD